MSALVAILSSSTSVSKDNIGTEECLCRDNLFFCAPEAITTAKLRDVLEREQLSSRIVAISVDEVHCVSKWSVRPMIMTYMLLLHCLHPYLLPLTFCHYSYYVIINYILLTILKYNIFYLP